MSIYGIAYQKLCLTSYPLPFIKMQHKMYYKHIDHIKAYREIKITCECGGKYTGGCHKSRHIATAKHQQYILSQPIV